MTSQVLGAIGLSGGITVASLLAEDILGSADLAGLANTAQILGGAVLAVPGARLMAARGRRVGLMTGYAVAGLGGALVIAATVTSSFALLLVGAVLFGAATTANSQARYAAVDLAEPARRGRDLSWVVWATTVGAVLAPNLVGPAGPLAEAVGLPPLVGIWLISLAAFALGVLWLALRLRPDPLILAKDLVRDAGGATRAPYGGLNQALSVLATRPGARTGVAVVALGHTVMVSVMVMTPLHMSHGGASLTLVGLVISVHVLGMYAFSPLVGRLNDAVGGRRTALAGAAVLLLSCLVTAQAPTGWSAGLTAGLFLLGLGWSATLVSGSIMLTSAVPPAERPGVQGAADLIMGLCGALGGGLSGIVVGTWGYPWLSVLGALVATGLAAVIVLPRATRHREPNG
ncbi:MAG: MFS transporter [Austwickia sp.]|nr:MFS transporter [Austwickia sp.]MBK8436243.1 MFS transporter [Austwickia sp.]MBK9101921.1 MFS transporter [Austwickia sp.]